VLGYFSLPFDHERDEACRRGLSRYSKARWACADNEHVDARGQ
jgi:hypothetical protein